MQRREQANCWQRPPSIGSLGQNQKRSPTRSVLADRAGLEPAFSFGKYALQACAGRIAVNAHKGASIRASLRRPSRRIYRRCFEPSSHAMQLLHVDFLSLHGGRLSDLVRGPGITRPDEVTARHVRAYLAALMDKGRGDTTMHDHARAVRTLLRFWHAEKYMPELVTFDMPRLAKRRLPVLTVAELNQVIAACTNPRDKAIVMLLEDSGFRRSEVCALDWDDIDFGNGLLRVRRGKGGKSRSAVVGAPAWHIEER